MLPTAATLATAAIAIATAVFTLVAGAAPAPAGRLVGQGSELVACDVHSQPEASQTAPALDRRAADEYRGRVVQ